MKILIIDDEKAIRLALKDILEDEGYEVELAEDGQKGVEMALATPYDIIFCDIKMPVMDGHEVLERLVKEGVESAIVMISGHADIDSAVGCIKAGAYDFISKPLDLNRILITVKNASTHTDVVKENKTLKKKIANSGVQEIVGNSPAILEIKEMIEKVAPTDARVLVTGSNGTGKELVARWLHEKSPRAAMPFIEVNCAAIPSELIESELFGHEKGAFTSALKQRIGKFEQADGGTLFLDEIGDMSLAAQAKVLRALQENRITRIGSDKDVTVNVRVIAATNKNLRDEIEKNNFREDLYHRLSVIIIHMPALNERTDDIPLLVDDFIKTCCEEQNFPTKKISPEALEELKKINWRGNVRELKNVIERLVILCGPEITAEDVKVYANVF